MKKEKDKNIYYADSMNFILRISDDFIMGEDVCLGSNDDIQNYYERPFTKEEWINFYLANSENKEELEEIWKKNYN